MEHNQALWFVDKNGEAMGHKHYGMRQVVGPSLQVGCRQH